MAKELFPSSFDWDDPDEYLLVVESGAREIAERGGTPYYVFVDPIEYVEWCREVGAVVDSQQSRAGFAAAVLGEGDAIPYDPDQPLWPMGITSMVLRSELGSELAFDDAGSQTEAFIDRYTDILVTTPGRWRSIVTASRYRVHDETELWQHFASAVRSQTVLTFCDDYVSVTNEITNRDKHIRLPHYGDHNPLEAALALAELGHGVIGVEHRHGPDFSFRAFEVTPTGYRPVPPDVLGRRLGTPGAPSLRCGWDDAT
ncbi:MAG: hypothetical protein ACYCS4_07975 [Acidimicrobiales bacterium]